MYERLNYFYTPHHLWCNITLSSHRCVQNSDGLEINPIFIILLRPSVYPCVQPADRNSLNILMKISIQYGIIFQTFPV